MFEKALFYSSLLILITSMPVTASAVTSRSAASDYVSENTYNNLYPYMNNTMRTNLNPGVTPSQSNAQINVLTRTKTTNNTPSRNVVARKSTSNNQSSTARAATSNYAVNTATARAANTQTNTATRNVSPRKTSSTSANTARAASNTNMAQSTTRQVVARSSTSNSNMQPITTSRTSRDDGTLSTVRQASTATYTTTDSAVSSARCMADYVQCMNDYCEREDTEYNRCYCSSKLAQIDAQYKPEIDRLIKEILTIKNKNYWTEEEMEEYWMDKIGQYTGDNSWANLDEALNIDWSGTESQVRGQQAFATGHSYCVQHLKNCSYMQTNLRDAYRSEIARDCATYESSLQRLKNAAESIVESYK